MTNIIPERKNISTSVKTDTISKLIVNAGGRCSFLGCNEYLLKDSLTLKKYNASNVAHIIARKINGPRGNNPLPLSKRNEIDNLILVCRKHHALIDNREYANKYPIDLLLKYKHEHERRIFRLTGISPKRKTQVICFKYQIGNELVKITEEDIYEALYPYYPTDNNIVIDCTNGDVGTKDYYDNIAIDIKSRIDRMTQLQECPEHVSVFALAPMPLLIYLGYCLSNKVKTELYQRHRSIPETWKWPKSRSDVDFKFEKIKSGVKSNVALIISLSGSIDVKDLPQNISSKYNIYRITLKTGIPTPVFLKSKKTLNNFKNIYQVAIRTIKKDQNTKTIHLFPAMPAPIAVLCGRELLKKIDPDILVYDNNKQNGGFYPVLTIKNKNI